MSAQPTQPEALRLADLIHCGDDKCQCSFNLAAAELGRLYALTTTQGTQPTDDDLNALADACTPNTETGSLNYRKFARAVLAKWGTPATGGEPVGTVVHNTAADAQFAPRAVWPLNNFHDLPLGTKLYTSPQPVRRALSPERVKEIVCEAGYDSDDTPDPERAAFINGLRHGERHHGITGAAT